MLFNNCSFKIICFPFKKKKKNHIEFFNVTKEKLYYKERFRKINLLLTKLFQNAICFHKEKTKVAVC